MIWEVGQDLDSEDEASLVNVIWKNATDNGAAPYKHPLMQIESEKVRSRPNNRHELMHVRNVA